MTGAALKQRPSPCVLELEANAAVGADLFLTIVGHANLKRGVSSLQTVRCAHGEGSPAAVRPDTARDHRTACARRLREASSR